MNPTLMQILVLVAVVLGAVGTVLHFTGPRTKTLWDDRAAAGIDKLLELLKKLGAGPGLALLVVGCVVPVALALPGCASNTRTRRSRSRWSPSTAPATPSRPTTPRTRPTSRAPRRVAPTSRRGSPHMKPSAHRS